MVDFLHISDIHIPDKQGDLWDGVDPCLKLEKLIELAKKLELSPSFTVITGDISHTGTIQSYNLAKKYINEIRSLGGPVFPIVGNMDNRKNFRNILLEKSSLQDESRCQYSMTMEGLVVIAMDSQTPGSSTGSFSEGQLDWLEKELDDHRDRPAIIAFHAPIFFFGEAGLFNKADALRFRNIVSKGNVLAVLNGHLHHPLFTMADGVHYVQAGSPVFENSYTERGRISHDSSSFNLLSYNDGRLLSRPVSFSEGTQLIERTTE
jgi:Icc protein